MHYFIFKQNLYETDKQTKKTYRAKENSTFIAGTKQKLKN